MTFLSQANLFLRFDTCFGISLFRWRRWTSELWFFPPNYKLVEHTHNHEHVETVHIWGQSSFYRRPTTREHPEGIETNFRTIGKFFTVPKGWSHWLETKTGWLVVMNICKWDCVPTATNVDLQKV